MLEALQYDFMQRALLAGVLASIACGVIGTYVVVKRIVFISGGISHASLGGVGIAAWLGWPPLAGALVFSLLAALAIGGASLKRREHEDTLIGALWVIGMAIGIVFIAKTPGYATDLMTYLFGNILYVSRNEVLLIILLNILVLALVAVFYKEFLALSLDEEFARLRGAPVTLLYLLLLCLVALTVIIMIRVVGIILVIALLVLPPAMSRCFTTRLHTMMFLSVAIGIVSTTVGIAVSCATDLPAGACIVLTAAAAYVVVSATRRVRFRRPRAS
ncbi:MAG: metal ABC transporter permease [Candidatus Hydrogenedentes bacterium]|nr:metal ABC transporter permease [Candidatus Hydrogenedentota bacterium]